jgi:hypothetical protein
MCNFLHYFIEMANFSYSFGTWKSGKIQVQCVLWNIVQFPVNTNEKKNAPIIHITQAFIIIIIIKFITQESYWVWQHKKLAVSSLVLLCWTTKGHKHTTLNGMDITELKINLCTLVYLNFHIFSYTPPAQVWQILLHLPKSATGLICTKEVNKATKYMICVYMLWKKC